MKLEELEYKMVNCETESSVSPANETNSRRNSQNGKHMNSRTRKPVRRYSKTMKPTGRHLGRKEETLADG